MSVQCEGTASQAASAPINAFERYLSLWVFLCIIAGIVQGQLWPEVFQSIGRIEIAPVSDSPAAARRQEAVAPVEPVESTFNDAWRTMALVETCYKSAAGGERVPELPH